MLDPQTIKFIELLSNPSYALLFLALAVWGLAWKGIALWRASRNNQRNWFIVMLICNTFGILEIIYIFYFSHPKQAKKEQNIDT